MTDETPLSPEAARQYLLSHATKVGDYRIVFANIEATTGVAAANSIHNAARIGLGTKFTVDQATPDGAVFDVTVRTSLPAAEVMRRIQDNGTAAGIS